MFRKIFLGLGALLGLVTGASAQTSNVGTLAQAVAQHQDAANNMQAGTAAVNTALTLTIPAVAGQSPYVTLINMGFCQDATGGATTQAAITSTNLNGFAFQEGGIASAGGCVYYTLPYPNGLKASAPGTATTLTIAAPGTHTAPSAEIAFYYGP